MRVRVCVYACACDVSVWGGGLNIGGGEASAVQVFCNYSQFRISLHQER